jgi:nucleotide-binding universal stress UspA family protein
MKILITTDGSSHSHHALTHVWQMLSKGPHVVQLLGVAELLTLTGAYEGLSFGMSDLFEAQIEAVKQQVEAAKKVLEALGIACETLVLTGDPASTIVEHAKTWAPDVLVMGAHGRGFIERAMLGSVSTHVLHNWHGNILVIHQPAEETKSEKTSA